MRKQRFNTFAVERSRDAGVGAGTEHVQCPNCSSGGKAAYWEEFDAVGATDDNLFCPRCDIEFDPETGTIYTATPADFEKLNTTPTDQAADEYLAMLDRASCRCGPQQLELF
jgi:RecJ-like exonuclease